MKVSVDPERCQGHNRCHVLVSEVFDVDELGFAVVVTEHVPDHLVSRALEAVRNCPERAITADLEPSDDAGQHP
ncbi:MAG TPA: ferredoxin [Acidimicrobiales bacterium]|nr:ferredoxin [Acidimicrobiales bacterium]